MTESETRDLEVAEGRLSVRLPAQWPAEPEPWDGIKFRLDPDAWAILGIEVRSFEIPEEIAADRLQPFLADPALPADTDYRREGLSRRVLRFSAVSDRGNGQEFWRRAWTDERYLRVATFVLQVPPDRVGSADRARLIARIDALVTGARFAGRILPVDRIAPAKGLKQTSVDRAVRLRVPDGWMRRRDKASGWTVIAAPGGSGLALWVQWDVFRLPRGREASEPGMFMLLLRVAELMPALFGKALNVWAYEDGEVEREGRRLRTHMMGKAVAARRGVMLLRFRLEIPEEDAAGAAIEELSRRLEREIEAAVITDPPDEDDDGPD